jgi:hypothetical protein
MALGPVVGRGWFGDIGSDIADDIESSLSGLASDIIGPVLSGILGEAAKLAEPLFNEIWSFIFSELTQKQYFPALKQLLALPTFLQQNFLDKIGTAADNIIKQAFDAMYDVVASLIAAVGAAIYAADVALDLIDVQVNLAREALEIIVSMKDLVMTSALTFSKDYAAFVADVLMAEVDTADFLANVESKFGVYLVGAVLEDATTYATGRIVEIKNEIVRDINAADTIYTMATDVFEAPTYDPAPLVAAVRSAASPEFVVSAMQDASRSAAAVLQTVPLPRTVAKDLGAIVDQLENSVDTGESLAAAFRYGVILVVIIYILIKSAMFLR